MNYLHQAVKISDEVRQLVKSYDYPFHDVIIALPALVYDRIVFDAGLLNIPNEMAIAGVRYRRQAPIRQHAIFSLTESSN